MMAKSIVQKIQQAIETESLAEFVEEYVEGGTLSARGLATVR